jgi:peptidoglycan/LPS O-acetylase OafA/YrhL
MMSKLSLSSHAPDGNTPPVKPKRASRLIFIDGLRALAMLMVLICHYWYVGHQWHLHIGIPHHYKNAALLAEFGFVGVDLFLVLSGFCLYWPFVSRGETPGPTLAQFLKRRCLRILPPYYVALVSLAILGAVWPVALNPHTEYGPLLKSVIWHALMVHNLRVEYVQQINGAFWSLALEFQLYLLFPVIVEAFRRFNPRVIVLISLISCTLFRSFLLRGNYATDGDFLYVLPSSLFGRNFEFVLGMFAALLVSEWQTKGKSPLRVGDYGVALAVLLTAFIRRPHGSNWIDEISSVSAPLYTAVCGLAFAGLLVAASRPGTWLNRALSARWMVFLGTISYSVYLIHLPVLAILHQAVARYHFSDHAEIVFLICLVTPILIAAGYLFHVLFERPFMPGHPRTERQAEVAAVISPAP